MVFQSSEKPGLKIAANTGILVLCTRRRNCNQLVYHKTALVIKDIAFIQILLIVSTHFCLILDFLNKKTHKTKIKIYRFNPLSISAGFTVISCIQLR